MKPNFAINVTDTAIGLLHRTSRGWMPVGEAGFDSPDLGEALGYLRSSALELSPQGMTTKIVLPPSQILYLEVEAPGPDKASRLAQIQAALEGRTPYAVEDLVFDWWGKGPTIKLAVVARETLDEAEAFAVEHRLNPVSFVTIPGPDQFGAEPWFGATKLSENLLPKGEKVTRDQDPVVILQRETPKADPLPSDTEDAAAQEAAADTESGADVADDSGAEVAAEAKAAKDVPDAKAEDETKAEAEAKTAAAALEAAQKAEAEKLEAEKAAAAQAEKAKADARARELAEAEAARLSAEAQKRNKAIAEDAERVRAEAERAKAALIAAEAERARQAEALSKEMPDPADNADLPAQDAAKSGVEKPPMAFASRRRENLPDGAPRVTIVGADGADPAPSIAAVRNGPTTAPSLTGAKLSVTANSVPVEMPDPLPPKTASAPTPGTPPAPSAAAAPVERLEGVIGVAPLGAVATAADRSATPAKPLPALGKVASLITADRIPGKAPAKAKSRIARPAKASPTPGSDQTMGTFGAKLQPQRGKPRFLGLMLTLALLVFLALVAAWSSIYLSKTDTGDADTRVVDGAVVPDATAPQSPEITEPEAIADLDPEAAADLLDDPTAEDVAVAEPPVEPVAEVAAPAPEPVAEAPQVVQTDGAIRGAAPSAENLDEIFLTTMDGSPPAFDAVALPQPVAQPDAPPLPTMAPPPFGTIYEFEADGRIKPTQNGVITPEGVWLIAARPNPEPPARPEAIALPEPAAATAPLPDAIAPDATASGALPSDAPGAFVPDSDVANNRPRARPADAQAPEPAQADDDAALAAQEATRITSLRPKLRPQSVLTQAAQAREAAAAASLAAASTAAPQTVVSNLPVALSPRPAARPKDFSKAVAAAVAEVTRTPASNQPAPTPEEEEEPEVVARASAAPRIPSSASVAKQATFKNAINLSKINLIGVYGTANNRYALVRSSSGRYTKVKVGDRVDGGTVAAITNNELRYKKGSRMLALTMPKG